MRLETLLVMMDQVNTNYLHPFCLFWLVIALPTFCCCYTFSSFEMANRTCGGQVALLYLQENLWHGLPFGIAKGNLHWLDVCCSSLAAW